MRRAGPAPSALRRCLARSIATTAASTTAAAAPTQPAAVIALALHRRHAGAPMLAALGSRQQGFATTTAAAPATESSSASTPPPPLFEDPRAAILEAALARVPEHGWTEDALAAGAASLGFPAVAHGMFGRGAVELVEHFADQVDKDWLAQLEAQKVELAGLPSARERLKLAIQLRLRLLGPQLAQWPQALALGLLPQNLEATTKRLALLADELCFVAAQGGSGSPSGVVEAAPADALDWYAQRATIGSVYVAAELFFLTDYSEDNSDTWDFLDRRLHDLDSLSHAPRSVQEGVLALHTAASALASAAASLAQPAVWAAVQRLPVNGALVGALQTALANVAAMAPPAVDPFRAPTAGAGSSAAAAPGGPEATATGGAAASAEFPAPSERDPYETKEKGKDVAAGLGGLGLDPKGGKRS